MDKARNSWSNELPVRRLSITPVRVNVRLYRRSRTASYISQKPSHIEYILRCHWTGKPKFSDDIGGPVYWWDDLPPTFDIRRRWSDIVKLNDALTVELKCTRVPDLPSQANIDSFMQNIAATGDACALSKCRLHEEDPSHEKLIALHTVYIEKYLQPYFADVSRILSKADPGVLSRSKIVRLFATSGPSSLQKRVEAYMSMDEAALAVASKALRNSWHEARSKKPSEGEAVPVLPKILGKSESAPALASKIPIKSESSLSLPGIQHSNDPGGLSQNGSSARSRSVTLDTNGPSHYKLFAQAAESEAFGALSEHQLANMMDVKERRAAGRRSMLDLKSHEAKPIQSSHSRSLRKRDRLTHAVPLDLNLGKSKAERDVGIPGHRPDRNLRLELMMGDICAGLRTIILHEQPPEGRTNRRPNQPVGEMNIEDRVEGSQEETLYVYKTYRKLLEEDMPSQGPSQQQHDAAAADDGESDEESPLSDEQHRQRKHDKERMAFVRDLGVSPELMPITWQTVYTWIDHESDLANDCRVKSAGQGLLRALKDWRQLESSVAQSYLGVSLNMLFQWLWPCATYENVGRMLTWIGQQEFEKIRQPTPPIISKEDRAQMENIFNLLDVKKRGSISAEDLCGGSTQDTTEAKLKNIVDLDTVRAVYGDAPIRLLQFLEIMCEDNFRGHEEATHCLLDDGNRLVYVEREVTNCRGWVFQDAPESEERQRARIEAIELEIERWRSLGHIHLRANAAALMQAPNAAHNTGALLKRGSIDPTEHLPATMVRQRKSLAASIGNSANTIGGTVS